jgi:hypothetical protein
MMDPEVAAAILQDEIELNDFYRSVGLVPHADLQPEECRSLYPCHWHPMSAPLK